MLSFLNNYEFLATWFEFVFFVGVFLFFEVRKHKKEREEEILDKIRHIVGRIFEVLLMQLDEKKIEKINKKQIKSFFKSFFLKESGFKLIPVEVYDDIFFKDLFVIKGKGCITIKQLVNAIDCVYMRPYTYVNEMKLYIFPVFFQRIRKDYFKNDKEIENIYNIIYTLKGVN